MENIRAYLAERNALAAKRVLGALRDGIKRLQRRPYVGRPGDEPGTREWSGTRYSYVIVYRVSDEARLVEIAGVFHTAQGERKL